MVTPPLDLAAIRARARDYKVASLGDCDEAAHASATDVPALCDALDAALATIDAQAAEVDRLREGVAVALKTLALSEPIARDRDALRDEVADLRRELAAERTVRYAADPALADGRRTEMAALLCPVCHGLPPEAMPDTPEAATAACRCPDCIAGVSTASAVADRDALRAIVAGRETAPSDEELAAHAGAWLWACDDRAPQVVSEDEARRAARLLRRADYVGRVRWWAWRNGRPCAWPVAETKGDDR